MSEAKTYGGSAVRWFGGSRTVAPPNPPVADTVERFSPETQAAIAAAQAAGDLLLRRVGRVGNVQLKSAKDPVTEVDTAAERCIRRMLRHRSPELAWWARKAVSLTVQMVDGSWTHSTGRWPL